MAKDMATAQPTRGPRGACCAPHRTRGEVPQRDVEKPWRRGAVWWCSPARERRARETDVQAEHRVCPSLALRRRTALSGIFADRPRSVDRFVCLLRRSRHRSCGSAGSTSLAPLVQRQRNVDMNDGRLVVRMHSARRAQHHARASTCGCSPRQQLLPSPPPSLPPCSHRPPRLRLLG